ncbi:hypothetical protein [Pseudomonas sp. UBA4194]|uniref:hypothetical protein n=1 Tax=Pseudomonas sp. UBA4194 TaxID=1947317 RepID=UPI0025D11FE7|nr:hypothetical protein [Pseudomonas sp. UBA4194]
MKNPPIALTRAIRKALYGQAHTSHDARHPGQSPDPNTYAPTLPAADAHGGINKTDYNRGSVLVSIPVYLGMAADDNVTLYWNNEYIDYGIIVDETVSFPMTVDSFYIPLDATSAQVHYHTKDLAGNERVSYSTNVVIKLTVPGNPPEPPDPADPSLNPNLQPPHNIPPLIPNAASAGDLEVLVLQYANMEEGDVISLFWAGEVFQYGPLVTADLNRDVRIVVPNATLVARPGMDLVVRYSIRDRVQNYSRYSPSVLTTVYAAGSLPEPTVEGTASGDLHIDQITDGLVEVHVNRHAEIGQADNVTLHWTGRPVAGDFQDFTVGPLQIGTDRYLVFQIPVDIAQVLIDSQAYVYYAVAPAGGGATKLSAGATFGVIGTRNELKAPQVPRASGGALNPENISEATIEVVVPANVLLAPGTTVTLTWTGVGVDGTVYHTDSRSIDSASAGGPVSFRVPKEKATKLIGSTLDLYYTLTLADGAVLPAPHLSLNVVGSSAALPPPEFDPELAAGDVLDPDSLTTGGINVIVKVLSTQYVPGKAVLHWLGTGASITPPLELPVTTTGERRFWVDKAQFVDPNLDKAVQVWYDLVKDTGERASSQTVLVNVSNASSQPWPAPEVHDASGGPVNPWIPVRPGSPGANSANFVLRDARLKINDVVAPFWRLPGGQDLAISWIRVTVDGEAQAAIPVTVLAASVGKTVQVSYAVLRNNLPGPASAVLDLVVSPFPAGVLPAAKITKATEGNPGTLDVSALTADAEVKVAAWPLIHAAQHFWLEATGTLTAGGTTTLDLGSNEAVGGVAGIQKTIALARLRELKDGSPLTLKLKVAFGTDGQTTEFPVNTYTVKSAADTRPAISEVRDSNGVVPEGGSTVFTQVTVKGTAAASQQVQILDNGSVKGTAQVASDGTWSHVVSALTVSNHSITAKALYGSQLVSTPRAFNVTADVRPAISEVRDSEGIVPEGGETSDNQVTVKGTAAANQQVQLFDNGSVSKGTAQVASDGTWTHVVSALAGTGRNHSITAKALYGNQLVSTPWTFLRGADARPTISDVRDSKGSVPEGGETSDTQVTVNGTAQANSTVRLFDNGFDQGTAQVGSDGTWSRVVSALTGGIHSITAKAVYGSEKESTPRTFGVMVGERPVISDVRDSRGSVPEGGQTSDTQVTVIGIAKASEMVEIYDNYRGLGTARVASNGTWSYVVSALTDGDHVIEAVGMYGANQSSQARSFSVRGVADTRPVISEIRDSRRVVPEGGSTLDSSVTVKGTAIRTAGQKLELYDNGSGYKGEVLTNANGDWQGVVSGLNYGSHSLTAVAKYGSGLVSQNRTFLREDYLEEDLTDFQDGTFNGWIFGPAAQHPHDQGIPQESNGNRYWYNVTATNNSAGVVLYKTFNNLRVGHDYTFSFRMKDLTLGIYASKIYAKVLPSGREILTATITQPNTWTPISGTFRAEARQMTVQLANRNPSNSGNDYSIDDLRVRLVNP